MGNSSGDLAWFWRGWFLEACTLDQGVRGVTQRHDERRGKRMVSVTIDNHDELVMPVVLDVTYADGTTEQRRLPVEIWYSRNRFHERWPSTKRVVRVEIDAERKFPDVDRSNNVWRW